MVRRLFLAARGVIGAAVLLLLGGLARAEQETSTKRPTVSSFSLTAQEEPATQEETTATTVEEPGPISPFRLGLGYHLYSDYVFRGMNLSEYPGEGREKPNHQMTMDLATDFGLLFGQQKGTCGVFTFGTWFEWYAAQEALDPIHGGQNLQQQNFTLSYAYEVKPVASTFTLGYTWRNRINAKSTSTSDWWLSVEHNDAWMWKWLFPNNDKGVLNPSFLFAQDVNEADGGVWMELGIKHPFEPFQNFTLTPGIILAIDHRYIEPIMGVGDGATQLAYVQYGLTASYNFGRLLNFPRWMRDLTLSGVLYFNDALGNLEDNQRIQDEFYGGMSVNWAFGG